MLGPGIHYDVPKSVYMADPCERPSLSNSIAGLLISKSPAHAWHAHPRGGGGAGEDSAALTNGTLIDSLLLGGDTAIVPVEANDWRTNAAKEARAAAEAAGKLAVLAREFEAASRTADILRVRIADQGVTFRGRNQVTVIWEEQSTATTVGPPVLCRARLDHWIEDEAWILDLKTTRSAAPKDVARSMVSYGYDIQHAAYTRAIEKRRPELAGRVRMSFVFVECEEPYQVLIAKPDGSMRALGASKWQRAVNSWHRGLMTKNWPGYAGGEIAIEAPQWALMDEEAHHGF